MLGLASAMATGPGELHGRVSDAVTGEPLSGVIVKVKGGFTSSGRDGRFALQLKQGADSVSFRSIGYESLTLPSTADFSDVRLNPKATRLNDVIVEAPDIYAKGDTLVFNVSRYAKANDNAIIDVIKRLPGIRVKDDGTIEYQGKPINKFYLDGNDFVGGQYGLATNNISHKDVKSVEVMENHQPVKALEGIEFPEEAGINLKLKEDARSRWVGMAQAAAGVEPFLYDGSLFTMRMGRKMQNLITLKADNTGWNPAKEIRDHELDDMFSGYYSSALWPEYISADMVSVPLSEKRTRDNLSWLANAITSWRHGDNSMRLNLNYMADRLDYNSGVLTDYFSSQIPTFTQHAKQRTQSHDLSAKFYSETNKRGYYLKDKLIVSGKWDNSDAAVTGSFALQQKVTRRALAARNDLKLVKRNEKRLFTLTSRNSFAHRPDRLNVAGEENLMQTVGTTDFRSTTETRFGKFTRFWKYYLSAGADLDFHRLRSELTGMPQFDSDGVHDAFVSGLYATPQADYERNGWRFSFRLPLRWNHYSILGQHDYIDVYPKMTVWRQLTAKSDLSASVHYRLSSPEPYLFYDFPVLSDYRNLFLATAVDRYGQDTGGSLSYRYRNPVKSFFVNFSASFNYRRSAVMSNQVFIDDFIISTFAERLSSSRFWNFRGGFSKGLGHSKMVTGVDLLASTSSASSLRDNVVTPYKGLTVEVKPYFKGSILRWLSANYEAEYKYSRLSISGIGSNYHTFHQNLFATVIPEDRLSFTVGAEHFLTRFQEGSMANLVLLDASAVWRVSHRVRLSLMANNLLNKQRYEYVNYGTLSRSEHIFRIRPRSIVASVQYRF